MNNELTNEQQAISQLYSVLCAVVQSDRTATCTAQATIETLAKLFEDENGPFQATDEMMGMTMAMAEAMNDIVKKRNKRMQRAAEGANILGSMNWN
jgi:hypothetical protein